MYDWPVDLTCLPDLPSPQNADYTAAVALREGAVGMAVQVLWVLSGRQYGLFDVIARPCPYIDPYLRYQSSYGSPFVVVYDSGNWRNYPCGCFGHCEIANPRTVHLPGPVAEIIAVTLSGVELADTQYTLEGDVLYRRGYDWPTQDLSLPLGNNGTWSVEYLRGQRVPLGVDRLTGLLAAEFVSACSGNKCRLPRNVTTVSRNGVTYQVYDPSTLYAAGKTGLAEVDMWLAAVNPNALLEPPSVI